MGPWYNSNMTTTELIDRCYDQVTQAFTPESARKLLENKPDPAVAMRMGYLGQQSNLGTLTEEEQAEYHALIDVGDVISLLKLKAQKFLDESA